MPDPRSDFHVTVELKMFIYNELEFDRLIKRKLKFLFTKKAIINNKKYSLCIIHYNGLYIHLELV
jgi:hypothetical protein